MKYLYNPVTGQLDDVETPNLGEKYFASAESDAVMDMINKKFGPGTMKYGSEIKQPEMKTPQAIFEFGQRNPAANGGMMRQNFVAGAAVAPLLSYPASYGLATLFGLSTAGGAKILGDRVTNHIKDNPEILNDPRFKAAALTFGLNIPGVIAPDADEMEREAEKIREMTKPTGFPAEPQIDVPLTTGEKPQVKIDTKESFPAGETIKPIAEGFPAETEQLPIIFENRKARLVKKALEELNPDTVTDISEIVKDYRKSKTRPAGIVTTIEGGRKRERFRPASTQPSFTEDDKLQLVNLVIDKFKEKENKLPSSTELDSFLFQLSPSASSIAKKNKINLSKRKADFDRDDPLYIENQRKNKQLKANENNTITNFGNENFFPDTIKLKDGSTINGEKFFVDNLVRRTELGPSRVGTYDTVLKNKELAELFNTNIRKIEEVIKNIRKSADFTADYPEPRPVNYGQKIALERIKEARKFLKPNELANIKLQEEHLKSVNDLFKNETLVVTDFPNLVERLNTTMDKKTGKIDRTIKKTDKEMIERSKHNSGLFDVSHTIERAEVEKGAKNIEFLRNRNFADYKTNQGFFKSAEAYVKNEKDDPEYDLRLEELDNYLKEISQRVKIDGKFFGLDAAMIDSETGEFLGFNRQLEYYGLPKMENGVPLKKVKKTAGGVIPDQEIINYANGGRINFANGTPNPQLEGDNFLNELEFKFNNIENVEIDDTPITFDDSKPKIEQVADLANPKNIPYYADVAVRAGLRVGEFGARAIPATGKLLSDILRKPLFKIKSSYEKEGDILDYGQAPTDSNVRFVGGPIFKNFLQNITPTSTEKLVGLDTLINEEKKKMVARGSSSLPVKVAETAALGAEVIAPIFPGLKLIQAYAKAKKLPVNDDTKELLNQEIDTVLTANGMDRRQFLQMTGAGGTVILAKMLGFGDEMATATKVTEKATAEVAKGVPPYFFQLVDKIKTLGDDVTAKNATQERQVVTRYKDFELTEDVGTGELTIQRIKSDSDFEYYDETLAEETYMNYKPGQGDEATKGTPADEYIEDTGYLRTSGPNKGELYDTKEGLTDDTLKDIEEILKDSK